ncbi:MAG: DUF1801 domain-containing protein [Gemmatimonadota bacterium]
MTPTAGVVPEFLAALEHPHIAEILALRDIILSADARITEEIKWNAPSFRTSQHFATFHLRAKDGVQVVLHLGAKPRPDATVRDTVADPMALLQWRSADRATITFRDLADIAAKESAFASIIRQWIESVE